MVCIINLSNSFLVFHTKRVLLWEFASECCHCCHRHGFAPIAESAVSHQHSTHHQAPKRATSLTSDFKSAGLENWPRQTWPRHP